MWHDCLHRKFQGIYKKAPRTCELSKVTGYMINTQKSTNTLHASNEQIKSKIKTAIPVIIMLKKIK